MNRVAQTELKEFLVGLGIPRAKIVLLAREYDFPTKKSAKALFQAYDVFLDKNNFHPPGGSGFCNVFAMGLVFLSALTNLKKQQAEGISPEELTEHLLGMMLYTDPRYKLPHAVNVAVHRGADKKLELVVYEPQETGKIVEVERKDLETCMLFIY